MKTWEVSTDGRQIYYTDFTNDATLELTGDFDGTEHRIECAKLLADKLNRRMNPLTDEEIVALLGNLREQVTGNVFLTFARAIEKAHGIGGQDE